MCLQDDCIVDIFHAVGREVLSMPTALLEVGEEADHRSSADAVTACVTATGAWNGAVTITCSHAAARRMAASMFRRDPGALGVSDDRDALGELASVVGGNLKGILTAGASGPCSLSLPLVSDGQLSVLAAAHQREYRFSVGAADNVWISVYQCNGRCDCRKTPSLKLKLDGPRSTRELPASEDEASEGAG